MLRPESQCESLRRAPEPPAGDEGLAASPQEPNASSLSAFNI